MRLGSAGALRIACGRWPAPGCIGGSPRGIEPQRHRDTEKRRRENEERRTENREPRMRKQGKRGRLLILRSLFSVLRSSFSLLLFSVSLWFNSCDPACKAARFLALRNGTDHSLPRCPP